MEDVKSSCSHYLLYKRKSIITVIPCTVTTKNYVEQTDILMIKINFRVESPEEESLVSAYLDH